MRPCIECGAAIGNGDATCAECGAQQVPSVGVNPETPATKSAPDETSWKDILWFELLRLVAVLCLLALPALTFQMFGTNAGVVAMIVLGLLYFGGMALMSG